MARGQTWGRRCDLGCESWPDDDDYAICPQCAQDAPRFSNLNPLPEDEAASLKRHFDFDTYYREEHVPDLKMGREESAKWDALYAPPAKP